MTLILRKVDSSLKGHFLSAPTEGLDINRTFNLQKGITQKGAAIYKSQLHFVTVSDPGWKSPWVALRAQRSEWIGADVSFLKD